MSLPTPIAHLQTTDYNIFIRARVVYKSNLITCKTGVKQLKLHFMDYSDTISAVAYGEEAKKFHEIFHCNKVYDLFNFKIQKANKSYTKLSNNFELTLNAYTKTLLCENEFVTNAPAIQYNFVSIAEILKLPESSIVDCIAACLHVSYLHEGTTLYNNDYQKRNLLLMDNSNGIIDLTLWNDYARNFTELSPFIIAVRKAIVNVYNNDKSLGMTTGTIFEINPTSLPESKNLSKFLDLNWRDSLVCRKTTPPLGHFKTKGVIYCIDCKNLYYEACKRCWRKLMKGSDGRYRCEKCKSETTDFKYKLMLKMFIGEAFTNLEVMCFNEFIEKFIGRSAEEVALALEEDPSNAEEIFKSIYYKTFIFNLHVTRKIYEGEMQPNVTVVSAMPINAKEYNKQLIKNLKKLISIE